MGMNLEQTVLRHPPRQELVAFAESLVDRSSSVSAFLAAHVSSCPRCTAEVRAIRASLEFTASAAAPEPSGDLARQILAGAREARLQTPETGRRHPSLAGVLFRAAVYVTATAALAVLTFGMAVNTGNGGAPSRAALRPAPQAAQSPETVSPEARVAILRAKAGASSGGMTSRIGRPTQYESGAPSNPLTDGETQTTVPSRTWTITSVAFSASSR